MSKLHFVKYLGENGETVPLAGAAAICSPWDLLIGSRYIARKLIQNLYGILLTMGLKRYAKSNQTHFMRLADWEGIIKSRHMPEFDKAVTCTMENFETADTFYRWCSSAAYTRDVSVPLLSISSLDDPVCTAEAIPWHECRANKNIVLATTKHGGHLGFFEGITAPSLWWVRAVNEFLSVLHSTSMHKHYKGNYKNVTKEAMVPVMCNKPIIGKVEISCDPATPKDVKTTCKHNKKLRRPCSYTT